MKYYIVVNATVQAHEDAVNKKLEEGWALRGEMKIFTHQGMNTFLQEMTRAK